MQTILGSGGAIGVELARNLPQYTDDIRLVSRNPEKVNSGDHLFSADLTDPDEVMKAVEGSEIVYLTAGFPYSYKVWKTTWPLVISNVLKACKGYNTKLVFFDNVYMYDSNHLNPMTEDTPVKPPGKKGEVRSYIAKVIMDEVNAGKIQALIARSADFYGPVVNSTSILTETVVKNLAKGKKAFWLGSASCKHSFTYTPDAGKATALLGNTPDAYNQVWHLPTAPDPMTGKEWIAAFAKEFNVKPKYQEVSKFMLRIMGLFMPVMKEMVEMQYQYDRDYIFDSSKFERRFDFKPTPYDEGIRVVANSIKATG